MRSTRFAIAVTLATLAFAAAPAGAQDHKAGGPTRQRPPDGFACATNELTAYTSMVVRYQRERLHPHESPRPCAQPSYAENPPLRRLMSMA